MELSLEALRPQGLQQILDFIYTSKLLVTSCNVRDVLKAATVLQMSNIAGSCGELINRGSLDIRSSVAQPDISAQSWCYSNSVKSNFHMEIKREKDPTCAKIYVGKSQGGSYAVQEGDVGLFKVEDATGTLKDSEDLVSFNREQIIVELNLNNQTLNVSKGSEDGSLKTPPSQQQDQGMRNDESRANVTLEEDGEPSEEVTSEEEDNTTHCDQMLPVFISLKQTQTSADAGVKASKKANKGLREVKGNSRSGEEREDLEQNDRVETQSFSCVRCPKIFNNRCMLEKHTNMTHNRKQV